MDGLNTENMWKDRFDKIVCIHYLPNNKERYSDITKELDRVGILKSGIFEFEYTVPWFFSSKIKWGSRKKANGSTSAKIQYGLQYYVLLKKLQYFGYGHVLVCEDDIVFRKNIDEIKFILDKTPSDFDIMNYEPFRRAGWLGNGKGFWGKYYSLSGEEVKQTWDEEPIMRYDSVVFNLGCAAFSLRGLSKVIERIEDDNDIIGLPDMFTHDRNGRMSGLNLYCTTGDNSLAIQRKNDYENKLSGTHEDNTLEHVYKQFDFTKFNLPSKTTMPEDGGC